MEEPVTDQIPKFLEQLEPLVASEGSKVVLRCVATGSPTPELKWFRDGREFQPTQDFRPDFNASTGEATLTITEVFKGDQGAFTCIAINKLGEDVTTAPLTVTDGEPPKFLEALSPFTAMEGNKLIMKCVVKGSPVELKWFRDGKEIRSTRDFRLNFNISTGEATLTINEVFMDDQGAYTCKAFNKFGKDTTTAPLIVTERKSFSCNIATDSGDGSAESGSKIVLRFSRQTKKHFSCEECHKTFTRKRNLKSHALTHKTDKKFVCRVCNKLFGQKEVLQKHLSTHTKEKRHACHLCNKSFFTKSHLKSHSLSHTGEKPYMCHLCRKCYSTKSNLKSHIMLHTGEKPHTCHICSKSFADKSTLKKHTLLHTGVKPHTCQICNKSFSQKITLQKHLFVHTGEKPHCCHLCNKSFTTKSYLKAHVSLHTGEKAHKCDVCNRTFAYKFTLTKHLLLHTGDKSRIANVKKIMHPDA